MQISQVYYSSGSILTMGLATTVPIVENANAALNILNVALLVIIHFLIKMACKEINP